ncbi:TerC family protein [Marinivivus vitaminiproducens]|nr:TerC family protein [Geminicoccaceae bacterium SCSIO 64248]
MIALGQILFIDLVLAGDNAVVVGMAAAGVEPQRRRTVIMLGIGIAVVLRIALSLVAVQLLAIIGLTLAGGILLLWVCWKLWRELRDTAHETAETDPSAIAEQNAGKVEHKSFASAIFQITLADVSMSLDNVLAVAGAAGDHVYLLVIGLAMSVAFMGLAATLIANLLQKHRWIAYLGLAVILWVALEMIWKGGDEVLHALGYISG